MSKWTDKIRICKVCNKELRRKHYGPDWICVKTGCPHWVQDIKERVRRLTWLRNIQSYISE